MKVAVILQEGQNPNTIPVPIPSEQSSLLMTETGNITPVFIPSKVLKIIQLPRLTILSEEEENDYFEKEFLRFINNIKGITNPNEFRNIYYQISTIRSNE